MRSTCTIFFVVILRVAFPQDSLNTISLDEVVVTGQFEPQSLNKSVYQVRTIDGEVIKKRSPINVQNVLNTELGIRFSNDLTLGTADISLMGMSGQNVKILLDGIPLLDRGATKESLNQIDINTVEKIEIVEGPMSVVYGSDALAGVINIITKKEVDEGGSLELNARIMEETAGDEYKPFAGRGIHSENITGNWQGQTWNAGAAVTRNSAGGWKEGREENTTFREWHPKDQFLGMGSVGFAKNQFNAWYRLNYLNEKILSQENTFIDPRTNALMAIDREYITNRFTHLLQADWRLNEKFSINGTASFQDYERKTQTTSINMQTGDRRLYLNEAGGQDESKFDSKVLRGIVLYKLSSLFSIQSGVDVNISKGYGDRIDGTQMINDYALFASTEITPYEKVNIRPGLRLTYNSDYDAPPVIPSLNTKFSLGEKLDLRLAYARGFRAPALRELYFSFHDASHNIDGNLDLKAEYNNSFTGSLAWRPYQSSTIKINATLGGFYNLFENMITLGNLNPENPNYYTYINVYRHKTTGITLNNSFHLKNLVVSIGFAHIGIYNDVSEEEASLPSVLWSPEVNTNFTWYIDKIGASLSAFYKFNGSKSNYTVSAADDGSEQITLGKIEAYHWADITATKSLMKQLEIGAGIKNLFDVVQVNSTATVGGTHSAAGPLPVGYGRSYFVSLNFKFAQ